MAGTALTLWFLLSSLTWAEESCKAVVYPACSNQMELTKNALAHAEASGDLLVFTFGADWCPWCVSLDRQLGDPKWLASLSPRLKKQNIALYRERSKLPEGRAALDLIASWDAQLRKEKLKGIPILAVVNASSKKAVFIDTAPLEKNTAKEKGHDPAKLAEAIKKAIKALGNDQTKAGKHARP